MSLFSKSFPSFSFFLPLFPLFRAPFWEIFFSFFCACFEFRVTKRGVFSSGGSGEGVHFFLSFWCEKTFVCILLFFFNENAFFFIIIISSSSSSSRACRRRRRIIIIALFVRGVGEKTLFETL